MCKKILFCTLSFLLFFGRLANANDDFCGLNACSKEYLSPYFINLSLKPTIRNNGELLANLQVEYGGNFVDDLVKKNKLLAQKPEGKIDKKTLKWIENTSFSKTNSPGIKYIMAPFSSQDNNYGADVFLKMLIPGLYPTFKSRPLFLSQEQLNAVRELFKADDFKMPHDYLYKYYSFNDSVIRGIIDRIYKEIFNKKGYVIGNEIKNIGGHTLIIAAHGDAADEFILSGQVRVHFSDVVNTLKEIGVPNNINIEIGSCGSGSGIDNINTGKTKDELIDLFINNKIKDLAGDMKNSFAYKFSKEIYSALPQFSGSVTGYIGAYFALLGYSYMINPENPKTVIYEEIPTISLLDINNEVVFFDKHEMAAGYKRKDFKNN